MNATEMLSRREFGVVAAACTLMAARPRSIAAAARGPLSTPWPVRGGVSLAGAEFGSSRADFSNANPGVHGKDYQYPQRRTINYFAALGLGLLRLPVRWERLQPKLNKPLDAAELARLRQVVEWAGDCGAVVVLDLHNYGRYQLLIGGRPKAVIVDEKVGGVLALPRASFSDFWRRVAQELVGNDTVVGLGLMNEPHDMGQSDWKAISQAAVDAIRQVNQEVYVVVAGDGWSNAHRFEQLNGARAWIRDPANRVVYEAHCYFDSDASGKYHRSYASELQDDPQLPNRGAVRLKGFVQWCQRNGVPGLIGEFGAPGDSGWRGVLENALAVIQQSGANACYWAAGEWWNDYPLSVQPRNDMRQPAAQQALLQQFLAPRSNTSGGPLRAPASSGRDGSS